MSAAQIIAELPKLNREQRAKISIKLRELEERDELQFMTEAAEIAFVELDRREATGKISAPRRGTEGN